MSDSPRNFLGLDEKLSCYQTAKAVAIPIPYEGTVSYGGGTRLGPDAIIDASMQVELYDDELECDPSTMGVATLSPVDLDGVKSSELGAAIRPTILSVLDDGKLPICFGGEHSITPAIVDAVRERHPKFTVVQFDAHADLRQEYEGDPMSHACAMARVRDHLPAVQLGIRNLSEPEAIWVKDKSLPIFWARDMVKCDRWMESAMAKIESDEVYVTIDLDAFDSSLMPATGTPEPGGLNWYHVTDFLRLLASKKKIIGFDIVELAPNKNLHACDFLAAKLAYKCLGYWWRSNGSAGS